MKLYTYSALERNGRLGNQMHQVASTIGLSRRTAGDRAAFNPLWEYRPFFNVPDEFFVRPGGHPQIVDGETNYFQELHYWEHIYDEVLDWFKPSPRALEEVKSTYEVILTASHLTALHVRRGDYLQHPTYHPSPSLKYFKDAEQIVREENPDTVMLIFSDDIPWCRNQFGSEPVYVEGIARPVEVADRRRSEPKDYLDLFLQARCQSHIISNSSYSWWGAILARNADAIYPSIWYGPELQHIKWDKMIPSTWRKVQC